MRSIRLLLFFLLCALTAHAQHLVIVDRDGSDPGGSNQMAMMVLLRSPEL